MWNQFRKSKEIVLVSPCPGEILDAAALCKVIWVPESERFLAKNSRILGFEM